MKTPYIPLSAVVPAVGVEADGEGGPDALLVIGAAEVDETLQVGVAPLDVWVGEHSQITKTSVNSRSRLALA